MVPESISSFEQLLISFAYNPVGTTSTVGGVGADDGVAEGTTQVKTKEEATARSLKKTPASPQTPQRPPRRRAGRSSPPHPDGADAVDGKTADKSPAMVRMRVGSAIGSTTVTVEGERRPELSPASAPGTPLVLPADESRRSSLYYIRKKVRGNPPTFSRFFLRHSTSAPAGGEEEPGEASRELERVGETKAATGEERGKGSPSPRGDNKGIVIGAASKRRTRKEGSCRGAGASRPRGENKGDWEEQKKSKKKKKRKAVVVVSPYFAAASSNQCATQRGGGVVEMVVQRRTRTKKKRHDQAAEPSYEARTAGGANEVAPVVADGRRKRKRKHQSVQLSPAERMADAYKRVPADDNPWVPPFSDHGLLQEFHFFDHWRVLVICMLLNRTTGREVQKVLPRLFLLCPDAHTTTKVPAEDIEEIIKHLGLQRKRSKMIKRMSEEYLQPEWTHVTQLHGIGKYAADAYAIFCSGMWRDVKPSDHKLVEYWRFLLNDKDARESMMVQKSMRLDQCQLVP